MRSGKLFAALVLAVGLALAPAGPAAAHDDNTNNCEWWPEDTPYSTTQDGGYWYTVGITIRGTPYSSCHNITVGAYATGGFEVRIRFYLSDGTNYANSWKSACSLCRVNAATDVLNGTHFRAEFRAYEDVNIWT